MSNISVIEKDIYALEPQFNAVLVDKSISFQREAGFALQLLESNDYALKIAMSNRQSVINAVTNIAAIGISLNPAKKQAYLVPRDGKICLDISYMGLMDLAVQDKAVKWAKAELVHAADSFTVNGVGHAPTHSYNPFSKDRGEIVGVYCLWKTQDGDILSEMMSLDEVNAVRDRSSAWKAWKEKQKKCPWVTDFGEMARKTVVKRASKYWSSGDGRMGEAINYLNTDGEEGLVVDASPVTGFDVTTALDEVEQSTDLATLASVWKKHGDLATKAKDRGGWNALRTAVQEKRTQLSTIDEGAHA